MADTYDQAYQEALDAAEMSVDTIQIDHVTADNISDKVADASLVEERDVNGNVTGYYKETVMSVVEPGKYTTSKKVRVYMTPTVDPSSTSDNVKLNFNVMPAGSADTKSGGTTVYIDRDEMLTNTLKAAGYDISPDIPPEVINQLWEEYYADEEADEGGNILKNGLAGLVDSYTGVPIGSSAVSAMGLDKSDIAVMRLKAAEFNNERLAWLGASDTALARILKAAAKVGLTDVSEIMHDDPETKALFRTQVQAGDYVHLTAVGDRDGSTFDTEWLQAFIKPMLMIEEAYASLFDNFPTDSQWDNDYVWSEGGVDTNIPLMLDNATYSAVHKHINIWSAEYTKLEFTGSFYQSYVLIWGSYIDPEMDWEVVNNYPEYGYATLSPHGTFYNPGTKGRGYSQQGKVFVGQYDSSNMPTCILIYDQESFIDYLGELGVSYAPQFLGNKFILFSNGTVEKSNPYTEKNREDPIKVTADMSVADIIVEIEDDPVWPDNKITVPEYDPVTNTTVNHNYYPVTPSVSDPRVVDWPDLTIPDIVAPLNTVMTYPDIPSISTPIVSNPFSPTAGSNRFWTIYSPSDAQMEQLGGEMWQQNVLQILKQTFVNPTDGIITWQQIYLSPTQAYQSKIYIGDYETNVSAVPVITETKIYKSFGIIEVPRYFNDYRDFTETQVSIYLPFIGFMDLDPKDIIGCHVSLEYTLDIITGTCLATISPKVGNNAECCYQFTGNAAVQLPITASDRSRLLSGIISGAMGGAALGGPVGAVAGGILGGVTHFSSGVSKSNGFSANAGALSKYKTPYLLIHRPIPADPLLYESYIGNPASVTATLRNLHGFTKVRECYVDIPRATDAEKAMIEAMLKQGVILP